MSKIVNSCLTKRILDNRRICRRSRMHRQLDCCKMKWILFKRIPENSYGNALSGMRILKLHPVWMSLFLVFAEYHNSDLLDFPYFAFVSVRVATSAKHEMKVAISGMRAIISPAYLRSFVIT